MEIMVMVYRVSRYGQSRYMPVTDGNSIDGRVVRVDALTARLLLGANLPYSTADLCIFNVLGLPPAYHPQ